MATTVIRNLGKLCPKTSMLFVCDMQEKFRTTVKFFPEITKVAQRLMEGADVLQIPTVITEQYPKGLGPTVSELALTSNSLIVPKTQFSMCVPPVTEYLEKFPDVESVMVVGIESHVCVQSTVLDLLERKYNVHVIVDAVSSRNLGDRKYAIRRMRDCGAFLTTSEAVLLQLVGDASHKHFKDVQKLLMEETPANELMMVFDI